MGEGEDIILSVHRCRFVDWNPSAITALAIPPSPLPLSPSAASSSSRRKRVRFSPVAVGHANGNISIYQWSGTSHYSGPDEYEFPPQAWTVRKTITGLYPSKVDNLAFALVPDEDERRDEDDLDGLRLFSTGGGSELLEWDLQRCCIKRTINSNAGSIWSLSINPSSSILALGCEDGTIRLLSISEKDTLRHMRKLDRVGCRILSLAWGPPTFTQTNTDTEGEGEWKDTFIISGNSDSSIRKWDVRSGRVLDKMNVDKVRGERTLVWDVVVLGNGTIVSGDSMGIVKFWDSKTCTQIHSFHGHNADVLSLCIGPDGKTIYSSSIDQKITQYVYIKTTPSTSTSGSSSASISRWIQTTSRRLHSHDIRALAIWPSYIPIPSYKSDIGNISPVLFSGGLDMSLITTPASTLSTLSSSHPSPSSSKPNNSAFINPLSTSQETSFPDSYHRRLSFTGVSGSFGRSSVKLSLSSGGSVGEGGEELKKMRLISCEREDGVDIWEVLEGNRDSDLEREGDDPNEEGEGESGYRKLLSLTLTTLKTNVLSSAISPNGKWLVVSDVYECRLFWLDANKENQLKPTRIKNFSSIIQPHKPPSPNSPNSHSGTGMLSITFTPDSSKLILSTYFGGYILIVDLGESNRKGDGIKVLRRFDQHRVKKGRRRVVRRRMGTAVTVNGNTGEDADEDVHMSESLDDPPNQESSSDSDEDDSDSENSTPLHPLITRLTTSYDGQWLSSSDNQGQVHIFNLDSMRYYSGLPTFPLSVKAMVFVPSPNHSSPPSSSHSIGTGSSPSTLLVLTFPNNTVQIYDVEGRQFPTWSKDLLEPLCGDGGVLRGLHDPVLGVTFPPFVDAHAEGEVGAEEEKTKENRKSDYILLWGSSWICKLGLNPNITSPTTSLQKATGNPYRKKRPRSRPDPSSPDNPQSQSTEFKLITKYRPILFVDFLSEGELVVVERPLVDVLAGLPPAYFRPKYGAS